MVQQIVYFFLALIELLTIGKLLPRLPTNLVL